MAIENEILNELRPIVRDTIGTGLRDYLRHQLFGYNSPFQPLLRDAVSQMECVKELLQESIKEVVSDPEFKGELKTALRKRLVNELVKAFSLEESFKELRNENAACGYS